MAYPICWQLWDQRAERPGRWSKVHRTEIVGRTLCGVRVPEAMDYEEWSSQGECRRCSAAEAQRRPSGHDTIG